MSNIDFCIYEYNLMAKIAHEMLCDIDKETIGFISNTKST